MQNVRRWVGLARASLALMFVTVVLSATPSSVASQERKATLPPVFANDSNGEKVRVNERNLTNIELNLRRSFLRKDAANEIIAFGEGQPSDILLPDAGTPIGMLAILAFDNRNELRWYLGDTMDRYYYRLLSKEEVDRVRKFLAENKVEELPELTASRPLPDGRVTTVVGGVQHVFLRLNINGGRRVIINNPPEDKSKAPPHSPLVRYTQVVDFFKSFKDPRQFTMHYAFHRPIEGLKIAYAPPHSPPYLKVVDVWMESGEIRLTLRHKWDVNEREVHRVLSRDGMLGNEVEARKRSVDISKTVDGIVLRPACESLDGRWVVGNRWENGELVCHDRRQPELFTKTLITGEFRGRQGAVARRC